MEKKKVVGWIQGRNGLYDITGIHLVSGDSTASEGKKAVYIDGIGKRDVAINGGLCVDEDVLKAELKRFFKDTGKFTKAETGAILAGLRFVQEFQLTGKNELFRPNIEAIDNILGECGKLSAEHIDALCERINFAG
jgi:hypothetical protein